MADAMGLRTGSPSAAGCGSGCVGQYYSPFTWWDAFFKACQWCRVDFMATHIYQCDLEGVKAHLKQLRK